MNASAAMTREVVTAPPDLALRSAWRLMQEHHFRHLPVVADGKLCGIVSDRDVLLRARLDHGAVEVPELTVGEAMTLSPYTCRTGTSVANVAGLMLEHKIDALPVLDSQGCLVGLVTSSDLLALLAHRDEATALPFDFRLKPKDREGRLAA